MLPIYSELVLWINDDTVIGTGVRDVIKKSFGDNVYGYLTVTRTSSTVKLVLEDYSSNASYLNTYTTINNKKWNEHWTKRSD